MPVEPVPAEPTRVDIAEWVDHAKRDPARLVERQATEIVLRTISDAPSLRGRIFLKGGVLMGVVYGSPRQTGDVDFTTDLPPTSEAVADLVETLNAGFTPAANRLGYPDLRCRVQSHKPQPRKNAFETASFPALKMKIAYARRGSPDEPHLDAGSCTTVLEVDLSYNEPVEALQIVYPFEGDAEITVYSVYELVAEKLRALLQQDARNRFRRQDIYDLDHILLHFAFTAEEQAWIHDRLVRKSAARGIAIDAGSFGAPAVRERAEAEWHTLSAELEELPAFEPCFVRVRAFYEALPWGGG